MPSSPLPAPTPAAAYDPAWLTALNAAHTVAAIVDETACVHGVTDALAALLQVDPKSVDAKPMPLDAFDWVVSPPTDSSQADVDSASVSPPTSIAGKKFACDRRRLTDRFAVWTFVALPEAASVHSQLLDVMPGMIYRCRNDRAWTMEYVSHGALGLCGHTAEDLERGDVSFGHDVIFSQDQERVWNAVQDALAKMEAFEVEYRIVKKDGSVRWAFERGRGIYDDNGTLLGLDGLIIDTTNNQVLREELRYARYLLRAVYDASPDALVIFSEKGVILDANEGFTRLFGYTPDSLVGFDPFRLIPRPEEHRQILDAANRVIGGAEMDFESHLQHQDGSEIPVELRLRRFEDDMGRRFVVSLIRDQRAQRAAKEELQRSDQRYRQMFEGNHAVKLLIDPEDGALIDANIAASRFYGYDMKTLLSMKIHDINTARRDEVKFNLMQAAQDSEQHFEFRHRLSSGEVVDVEVHTGPVVIDGRPLLYSIVHDISERRRLERELRASQRMEALGRLAGGIAHDFNNLMTVVSASATLAQHSLDANAEAKSHLVQIGGAARRAAELTRQLLAFGRRQVLEPQEVDVNDVIRGVDAMIDGLLTNSPIKLVRRLDAESHSIRVDVAGLEQVLINLVLNARDAISGSGEIRISTDDVMLEESIAIAADIPSGKYVVLRVEDTGEGIAQEHLASIFDPFFSTKAAGTGLGLSSVYGIVKQSGGHIAVDSTVGEGTRFDVFLPLVGTRADSSGRIHIPSLAEGESPEDAVAMAKARAAMSWSQSVGDPNAEQMDATTERPPVALVVEDTDVVRRLLTLLLQSNGWDVVGAADGRDAIEAARATSDRIDLLVTDIRMPQMGGQELADRLRQDTPWLPVLFVSGWLDDVPLHIVGHAGTAFLQKPPDPEELLRVARTLLAEGEKSRTTQASASATTKEMRPVRSQSGGESDAKTTETPPVDGDDEATPTADTAPNQTGVKE